MVGPTNCQTRCLDVQLGELLSTTCIEPQSASFLKVHFSVTRAENDEVVRSLAPIPASIQPGLKEAIPRRDTCRIVKDLKLGDDQGLGGRDLGGENDPH